MAWYKYVLKPELDLELLVSKSRDVAKAFNDFADGLEKIEKKYMKMQLTKSQESEGEDE